MDRIRTVAVELAKESNLNAIEGDCYAYLQKTWIKAVSQYFSHSLADGLEDGMSSIPSFNCITSYFVCILNAMDKAKDMLIFFNQWTKEITLTFSQLRLKKLLGQGMTSC